MNKGILKRIVAIILTLVLIPCSSSVVFAETAVQDTEMVSEYDILLGADGLLSGYDYLDNTDHLLGEQSIHKTYVLSLRYETFSINNKTGSVISKTGLRLVNGNNPTSGTFTSTSSRNADYLNGTVKARFEDAKSLSEAGYTSLDKDATAYYYIYFSAVEYAVLIQITPNGTNDPVQEARNELGEQIDRVTGENAKNFYQTGDRYNGSTTSKSGFWAELQEVLTDAQKVYDDENATVDNLNNAKESLTEAADNLIPSNCINPTALYEKVNSCKKTYTKEDYTQISWESYEETLHAAEEALDGVLIDGALLPVSNQAAYDSLEDAIIKAEEALYWKDQEDFSSNAKDAMPALLELGKALNASDYTSESWKVYHDAYAVAKNLVEKGSMSGFSDDQVWQSAFDDLYDAYYWGLVPSHDISVHLTVLDPTSARNASGAAAFGVEETVRLSSGFKLKDAVSSYGVTFPEWVTNWDNVNVFINGIYVVGSTPFEINALYSRNWPEVLQNAENISLHPNDEVVVTFNMNPLSYHSPVVGTQRAFFTQYEESLFTTRFISADNVLTVQAGEQFDISLEKTAALIDIAGSTVPAEGMTLFVSAIQSEKGGNAPAYKKLINNGAAVTTDEQGKASLSLYEEGWVLLTAYDLREDILGNESGDGGDNYHIDNGTYYSLNTGAAIWVHVVANDDTYTVKDTLSEDLDEVYYNCDRSIFPEEKLEELDDLYATAADGINDADTIGSARNCQQAGIEAILELQKTTQADNKEKVAAFRAYLDRLPDDISLISKTQEEIVTDLISAYAKLNAYQKSQLSSAEISKYEDICSIETLPDAKNYAVNVTIKADNEEAASALSDMQEWLSENISYEDVKEGSEIRLNAGMDQIRFGTPYELIYKSYKGKYGKMPEYSTDFAPGTEMFLNLNCNYSAYYLVRNAADHAIHGNGWTIIDDQENGLYFDERSYMNYNVKGNVTVMVGTTEYEIKNVEFSGVYDYSENAFPDGIMDRSDYKGKDTEWVNLWFQSGMYSFEMPYNDVEIVVSWGPVHDSKTDALNELTKTYNSYIQGNYTDEKWKELKQVYCEGVQGVMNAADPAETKNDYISRMEAVESLKDKSTYGSVTVTVSNNTLTEGAWYDKAEPFINETIELTETDTMMTVLLRALEENGFEWDGTGGTRNDPYTITYISAVSRGSDTLTELMPGYSGSGWMGMLNNWFVNLGFQSFSVENGGLKNGDHVEIVYTCDLGMDVRSGVEGITDTKIRNIEMTNGSLSPSFDSSIADYIFVLDENENTSELSFEAEWRTFQSRAYKDKYDPDASDYYASGDSIYLKNGDVLYISGGDPAWPSMSGNDGLSLTPSVYKVSVVTAEAKNQVADRINGLQTVKYNNYQSVKNSVELARTAYEALSDHAKAKIDAEVYEKLTNAEQMIADYSELDKFKTGLAEVDTKTVKDSVAKHLVITYENLTESQTGNLTLAEKNKAESLRYGISYEWAEDYSRCTACIRNRFDENDTYTETVDSVKTVIREVSETASGKSIYKAVFTDERLKAQTVTVITPKKETESGDNQAESDKEQAYANRPVNKITASSLVKEYSTYKKTFSINAKVLGGAKLSYSSSSGKVKVSSKGVITVPAKYVGKVTITIKAADTDQYKAVSKKITITVNPKTTSIVSVKNTAAGKMTVKWKRNSAVTGYQLQYSTSSSFKSGNKTMSITSNKTLSKTVKSLKKNKTYYVRIRTYKKVGSVKYYSKWSTKKSVKISR